MKYSHAVFQTSHTSTSSPEFSSLKFGIVIFPVCSSSLPGTLPKSSITCKIKLFWKG